MKTGTGMSGQKYSSRMLFHLIGLHATVLIQEGVNATASGDRWNEIKGEIYIHPDLSELAPTTLTSLGES